MAGEANTTRRDAAAWDNDGLASPHTQQDKATRVRRMFDAIAPTYELVNRLASAGRDAFWRREMVRLAEVRPGDVLLDVACGTGDVARRFASGDSRPERIVALDFSWRMIEYAGSRPIDGGAFCQADALRLPVADRSVSIVTCAFGIRNFQDLGVGLREMFRVLRPGGRVTVLEFSLPERPILRRLYLFYFNRIMPMVATVISGDRSGAYRYLPRSVVSFLDHDGIVASLKSVGFADVQLHRRSFGIVTIYVAWKSDSPDMVRI